MLPQFLRLALSALHVWAAGPANSASRPTPPRSGLPSNSATHFRGTPQPRYLLRDRDRIFGDEFTKRVKDMGIKEVLSAPRSPWQRAHRTPDRHSPPGVSGPRDCLQRGLAVSAREVVPGVLSRIPDAPLAGWAHAGTAARAPGGTRSRRCHTAGRRSLPPVRAARSLNFVRLHPSPSRRRVRPDAGPLDHQAAVRDRKSVV